MTITFSTLSTKDLAALSQRIITISDEPAFAVVKDNPLLQAVKTVYDTYDTVYTKKAFSGKSELLLDADSNRDTPFGGLKFILLGHIKVSSSPYLQDAKDIYAIIEKFGIDLDRYKWAEETAQMKKLLEELEKSENAAKIQRMQLMAVFTQIKEAQTAFEKLFNEVAGENAELRMLESATSFRKTLEPALRNYLSVVKAMNTQPGWKELYAKLDEVVKAANNSRSGSAKTATTVTDAK
jgi:soluble cytochrome b562